MVWACKDKRGKPCSKRGLVNVIYGQKAKKGPKKTWMECVYEYANECEYDW